MQGARGLGPWNHMARPMRNLEEIQQDLRILANHVEDIQRELVEDYACLCVDELGDVVSRLRATDEIVGDAVTEQKGSA